MLSSDCKEDINHTIGTGAIGHTGWKRSCGRPKLRSFAQNCFEKKFLVYGSLRRAPGVDDSSDIFFLRHQTLRSCGQSLVRIVKLGLFETPFSLDFSEALH